MRPPRDLPIVLTAFVLSCIAGYCYVGLTGGRSYLAGMIYGGVIGCTVSAFDRGVMFPQLRTRMRRWSSLAYIITAEVLTVVLVVLGFAAAGLIVWTFDLNRDSFVNSTVPTLQVTLYALAVAAALVFVTRMRDLLGHDIFVNLLVGRYHRPIEERRVFLFVDVVGSTAFARQHGDLKAQDYLGSIFAALAEPVRDHRGTIDDYIGDMAMITWAEASGVADARCLRCVFAIIDAIEASGSDWILRFGQVPRVRAALHGGAVVVAEIGVDRHKISYFGDVVNTTARIEALTGQIGSNLLMSADLLARIGPLPAGVAAISRGEHVLKGRDTPLEVFSVARSCVTVSDQTASVRRISVA